jgi:cell division septum initiation protein DivIVA
MLNLIDELENLLQRSIRVPASGKLLVDEAVARQILAEMREAVPDEARLGQRIASERERVLADARSQARRMLEEAQAQLNGRLDDQAVVQAARQRAREIHAEAEQRAAGLRTDANSYVLAQLGALESRLQRLLREVQAGQRSLGGGSADRRESSATARGSALPASYGRDEGDMSETGS